MTEEVLLKAKELFTIVDDLQAKVLHIFHSSEEILVRELYDTIAIDNCGSFQAHRRDRYTRIMDTDFSVLDKNLICQILDIRIEHMNFLLESIAPYNIGTCLNVLREIYNDVLTDFSRPTVIIK